MVVTVVRCPLHRTRSLGDQKLAQSLNDLSKATKKRFLREILVRSLISQPSLLHGWKNWRSLTDHWETTGRFMRSLSAHWALLKCSLSIRWVSLSVRWAFIEFSLRDRFPWRSLRDCFGLRQNFEETMATIEITGWSLTDHWQILVITGRSLKDRWEIWPFLHRSTIFQWSPPLCKGGFITIIISVVAKVITVVIVWMVVIVEVIVIIT